MVPPGISTGGGGLSGGQSSSGANSGNGDSTTSSADRVTKQFVNVYGGAAGLDLSSYLGATNRGFYEAVAGEQELEAKKAESAGADRWLPYVALGVVTLLGFGFILTRGGK